MSNVSPDLFHLIAIKSIPRGRVNESILRHALRHVLGHILGH